MPRPALTKIEQQLLPLRNNHHPLLLSTYNPYPTLDTIQTSRIHRQSLPPSVSLSGTTPPAQLRSRPSLFPSGNGFHKRPSLRLHPHSLNPLPHGPNPHPPPRAPSVPSAPTIPPPQLDSRPEHPASRGPRAPVPHRKGQLGGTVERRVERGDRERG